MASPPHSFHGPDACSWWEFKAVDATNSLSRREALTPEDPVEEESERQVPHHCWTASDLFTRVEQVFGLPASCRMFLDEYLCLAEVSCEPTWVRKRTSMGEKEEKVEYHRVTELRRVTNGALLKEEVLQRLPRLPWRRIELRKVLRFENGETYVDIVRHSDSRYSYGLTSLTVEAYEKAEKEGFAHGDGNVVTYLSEFRSEQSVTSSVRFHCNPVSETPLPRPLFPDMDLIWDRIPGSEEDELFFLEALERDFVGDQEECDEIFSYRSYESWQEAVAAVYRAAELPASSVA